MCVPPTSMTSTFIVQLRHSELSEPRRIEPQRHRDTEKTQRRDQFDKPCFSLCACSVSLCLCRSILHSLLPTPDDQNPITYPICVRGDTAPCITPFLASSRTAMTLPLDQLPVTCTLWPRASSSLRVASGMRPST